MRLFSLRRQLSLGRAIGACVFLFLGLSYRKKADLRFAGRLITDLSNQG
jgi:hypothetical protein